MPSFSGIWRRLPFLAQLLAISGTALLLAGIALLVGFAREEARGLRAELRIELAEHLEQLPHALVPLIASGDTAQIQHVLDQLVARRLISLAELRDGNGAAWSARPQTVPTQVPGWFLTFFDLSDVSGSTPVVVNGRRFGDLQLRFPVQGMVERTWARLKIALGILLATMGAEVVGLWMLLRTGLAPLKRLEDGANAMAAGDLTVRLASDGNAEMRMLTQSFNRMAHSVSMAQHDVQKVFEALQESQERYQSLVESSPIGIAVLQEGRFVYVNPAAVALAGAATADELIGTTVLDRVHPDFRDLALQRVLTSQALGRPMPTSEQSFLKLDGTVIDVEIQGVPIQYLGVPAFQVSFQDVGARKQAFEALHASEEKWRSIVNNSPDGICIVSTQGCVEKASVSAVRMFGYASEAQLLGKSMFDFVDPAQRERATQLIADLLRGTRSVVSELTCIRQDGSRFSVEANADVLRDALGQPTGVFFIARDISERKAAQLALEQSESRFHGLFQNVSSVAVQGYAMDGTTQYWNKASELLYGYSAEQALGANLLELIIPPAMRDGVAAAIRQMAETGQPIAPAELTLQRRDGSPVIVYSSHAIVPMPGRASELFCIDIDLTERKQAQARLLLSATVFAHSREAIMITDTQGTIVEVNDTFSRITGYSREEAIGQNPRILKSGRQSPEHYASMWSDLLANGHWSGEAWNRRKNGEVYAELQTIHAVRDAQGQTQNYVSLFSDITPMKEQQQQLEHMAHYDALTGLPNRVLLVDRLEQAMAHGQRHAHPLAVVYLDLDEFKTINDCHGHSVGDELLVVVSQRLKAVLRDGDTLSRLGGDVFVAVLADVDRPHKYELVLDRMLHAVAEPVVVGDLVLRVAASIGVTLFPDDGVDVDHLLRHADQAMYQAKQAGGGRYQLFDVARNAAEQNQRDGLKRIGVALEQGELVLYYQPKVNMRTGQVIGAEALIRWQHPQRGLLAPAAFLPLIEDHPLGIAVGDWVISSALDQMAAWHAQGFSLPVSVNVSAEQLQQEGFVARLVTQLAVHPEIPPHCLEIEILETSALKDINWVSAVLQSCHAVGVGFALDDFGTGYSSLTYLKHLPAKTIKIDQSFVRGMLTDPSDLAIVKGVIGLASAFGRVVIAEGVETAELGRHLLALGCELAQGYGVARPMPAADMASWVLCWQAGEAWTA